MQRAVLVTSLAAFVCGSLAAYSPTEQAAITRGPAMAGMAEAAAGKVTETERIHKLIAHVEGLKGVTFVRNGADHSPSEAAKLLRHKHKSMPPDVTAEQFIEHAGAKSSTSGRPYQIRFADGRTVPSADFLREKLKEIEQR